MFKLKEFIGKLSVKKFDSDLEKARKMSQKLYDETQDYVMCEYCNYPLPKTEAVVVYNIEEQRNKYSHNECFEKNNPTKNCPIEPKVGDE